MGSEGNSDEMIFKGIAASPGVAHGPAFVLFQKELEIPSFQLGAEAISEEIARFERALLQTRQEISGIREAIAEKLSEEEAQIFDAHQLVLEDKALIDEVIHEVEETSFNIEYCFHEISNRYIDAFANIGDPYIKERATDIRDVSRRVLQNLLGQSDYNVGHLTEEKIIVTEDLTPSSAALLEPGKVMGLVMDAGSRTSHAVIMARSIEIPAVVGLHNITQYIHSDDDILVDGHDGIVIINPSEQSLFRYGRIQINRRNLQEIFRSEAGLPADTVDGEHLILMSNIEGFEEIGNLQQCGCEGVGLYRTEGLFLKGPAFPDEEEQFTAYSRIVSGLAPNPVTIRTLDLGGDKNPHSSLYNVREENPFMGFRAIRFSLENTEVFLTQLRAILRASCHGNVRIMYPMISGLGELVEANGLLKQAKRDLQERGQEFDENIAIGSMIEVPSAATIADLLAQHCDFFSIGTNDLIQYLLAVDRVNDRIAHLYEPSHPAVVRVLKHIVSCARKVNIPVSVCGEMAGDPVYAALLFGLGVDELSMIPSDVPEVKYLVRKMRMADTREMAENILRQRDPDAIFDLVNQYYEETVGKQLRSGAEVD